MKEEMLSSIKSRLIALHQLSMETISDEEMASAIVFFRRRQLSGRPLSYEDGATLMLLQAVRTLRNCIPIESGESPFEYKK